jgi:arylsulfatase A-like enzyme
MKRRQFILSSATGILGAGFENGFSISCRTIENTIESVKEIKCPNILWIMLDDCRYDAVGCYGRSWVKTPHIDRLAHEGVMFEAAIVQNPVCIPSRRCMKTGYYAYEMGPMEMGKDPEIPCDYIDTERTKKLSAAPNLLDSWTKSGMKPVNFGKIHAFPESFDDRGDAEVLFDVNGNPTAHFLKTFGENSPILKEDRFYTKSHHWQIGGALPVKPEETETWRLCDMALETLDKLTVRKDPFFLRVSFHAPHVACYVPEEFLIDPRSIQLPLPSESELASKPRFEQGPLHTYCGADLTPEQTGICRGTYYGMVSLVDVQVGRIISALEKAGQLDNTIIAFTSDQGFQLGEHGLWKKRVFYEANVRVPLIIRYPEKIQRGTTISEPVELVDFVPTLMELSGLVAPKGIKGASLVPLIQGKRKTWRKACFSEIDHSQSMYEELRQGTGRRVMVRTEEWKLDFFMDNRVKDPDGALYHLKKDPGENNNVYYNTEFRNIVNVLQNLARDWSAGRNMFVE